MTVSVSGASCIYTTVAKEYALFFNIHFVDGQAIFFPIFDRNFLS